MKLKPINVKIPDELRIKLKKESKISGIKIWKIVTVAIEKHLNAIAKND